MTDDVSLRRVEAGDLSIFFDHQMDPVANRRAAFPARDYPSFMAHWEKILKDGSVITNTILYDGEVVGNIVSWEQPGEREVGYWIGRDHWGKGIATRALAVFLENLSNRPLFAHVAEHNYASIRVLEKCGFSILRREKGISVANGDPTDEVILMLDHPGAY